MFRSVRAAESQSVRPAGWALIGCEILVAVGAWYGGVGLIADNSIGMLPDWLAGTPFDTWTWPGVFLLMVVAVPMTIAAVGELSRRWWANRTSMLAGLMLVGWIAAQWLIFQRYFVLQPLMFGAGAVVFGLAWWTRPATGGRHHHSWVPTAARQIDVRPTRREQEDD